MTILKLFFPGEFEDAYVYMGRLVSLYGIARFASTTSTKSPRSSKRDIPTLHRCYNWHLLGMTGSPVNSFAQSAVVLVSIQQ